MSETEAPAQEEPETGRPAANQIDMEALADRIYRLLIEEARLERERLGRNQVP